MTATPTDPASAGDQHSPAAAAPASAALTFEDQLHLFWRRNRTFVIAGCVIAVLAIVGVGVWDHMEKSRELEIQQAYATAATPEALKAFADSHAGHALAGAAYLRLADDAFANSKAAEAVTNYEKAAEIFKDGPFAARTKLGLAIARIASGKAGEGATGLKALAEDANQFKGIRVEAAYHLASLAADTGVASDVVKYSDLLMQIDPTSPWTQRAFALRATLPPAAVAPEAKKEAAPVTPAIQFTPKK
jgi:predicted negative regulator of RcsB-dependent stress response